MRILHVLDHSLPIGSGYSYRSRAIVRAQQRLRLDPIILTSPKQGSRRDECEIIDAIPHYRTAGVGGQLPFVREVALMIKLATRLASVARDECADVIHAHSPLLNGLPALWAGRRLQLPVVYEVRTFWEDAAVSHGTFAEGSLRYRISRALETRVLRRANAVVAICRGIRGEIAVRGIDPRRVTIIPNGVDAEWLEPRPRARELAARLGVGTGPVFAYIGSFSHYEGLPFLVRAAPGFLRRFPGSTLLLVGSGRDDERLRAAAKRAGAGIILTGRLSQEQVRDLYTFLDVLVLPRRRIRLTDLVTPLKPLEAMAAGAAVLASDIGGHAELIQDGETGLLFKAESRDSLVEQAVRLGEDAELRRRLADNARRWVESERTWDRIIPGYLPVYRGAA
ncbi:MAG TPA: TIGR04063 family PEP-CTERM/XrtA system glycosyltransferase [Methylomirabilota bacterium]|nr:TIGR04063 family PEP-CTERM/XrtA system glycosyltransferase [Methylomirabilota bacterium]